MGKDWKLILVIFLIVYLIYRLLSIEPTFAKYIVMIGFLYGGGIVIINYVKSIKENLIDSNRSRFT